MKYLSIKNESLFFFKDDSINEVLETDILINQDIYSEFFKRQDEGKVFRIKNQNGITFNEIFEEVNPTVEDNNTMSYTLEERIKALELAYAEQVGGAV